MERSSTGNPFVLRDAHVLPRRWVVERTFGWLCHSRRLRTDYESLLSSSEAMIYLVMIRLMIKVKVVEVKKI